MERILLNTTFGLLLLGITLLTTATDAGKLSTTTEPVPTKCTWAGLKPHPNYCTKFLQCIHGVPVVRDCPHGTVFTDTYNICVRAGSEWDTCTPEHLDRECARKTVDVFPHPTRCVGYYNCSDYEAFNYQIYYTNGYEKECTFPQQFDQRLRRCVDYKTAICGGKRQEIKWRCNYYAYGCWSAMCRPCWVDHPSCVGKTDGLWPVSYALLSPLYMECKDERDFKGRMYCPESELFDPDLRKCVKGHSTVSVHLFD